MLRAWFDDPVADLALALAHCITAASTHQKKTHLVKIDGVHIQSVPRGGAVLWWRKVGPAIQPSTAIGMALEKVTQTPELCSGNASIFGAGD